jgi:hypothetical protein
MSAYTQPLAVQQAGTLLAAEHSQQASFFKHALLHTQGVASIATGTVVRCHTTVQTGTFYLI